MAKFDHYSMPRQEKNKILDEFYFTISCLKNRQQIINFFKDLLTPSEAVMLARRIQIAELLIRGFDYREISKKLKTGVDTIAKVQYWLKDGFGDYIKTLEKVIKREEQKIRQKELKDTRQDVDPNSLQGLANRYPLYWGLTNAIHKIMSGYGEKINKTKKEKELERIG